MQTVRFPDEQPIGKLLRVVRRNDQERYEEVCVAQGTVTLPEQELLVLEVDNTDNLSPLDGFHPSALFGLTLWKLFDLQDDELRHVGRLTGLRELGILDAWHITDAGIAHLAGLVHLEILYLDGVHVTDAGLAYLAGLTKLRELSLWGAQIHDEGLRHLHGLSCLEKLTLNYTAVSDASLPHLQAHTQLKRLSVTGTHLSPDGVSALRKMLPQCTID